MLADVISVSMWFLVFTLNKQETLKPMILRSDEVEFAYLFKTAYLNKNKLFKLTILITNLIGFIRYYNLETENLSLQLKMKTIAV